MFICLDDDLFSSRFLGLVENAATRGKQLMDGLEELHASGQYPITNVRSHFGPLDLVLDA